MARNFSKRATLAATFRKIIKLGPLKFKNLKLSETFYARRRLVDGRYDPNSHIVIRNYKSLLMTKSGYLSGGRFIMAPA